MSYSTSVKKSSSSLDGAIVLLARGRDMTGVVITVGGGLLLT
jgi:hypothetical protein